MVDSLQPDEACEWEDSVSSYVLGNISEQDKTGLTEHLATGCLKCAAEFSRAAEALEGLAEAVIATPPHGSRERFLALLDPRRSPQDQALKAGILFKKFGVQISRSEGVPWLASKTPGIWARVLFVDAEQHCATSIVRLDPATYYPSHQHRGPEEIFLLSGSITIEGQLMQPGDYCHAGAGSVHGQSFTDSGCTFLLRSCELEEMPVVR